MTHARSFRRSALTLALAAVAGVALAQTPSTSPSPTTPSAANPPAATSGMTTPSANPTGAAPSATAQMPSRTDSADAAWKSLDTANRGFLSKSDVQGLDGISFDQADTNKDGRLSKEEFAKAWSSKK